MINSAHTFIFTAGTRGWCCTRSAPGYKDEKFYFTTSQDVVKWWVGQCLYS